jgi:hypothetical protein
MLAVGHASGRWSVELYDRSHGQRRAEIAIPRASGDLVFPGDDRLACRSDGELLLVSVPDAEVLHRIAAPGQGCAAHPGGRHLALGLRDAVLVLDLASGATRRLATARHDLVDWMHRAKAGDPVAGFHPVDVPRALAFTTDGQHLAVATEQGLRVYSWDAVLASESTLPAVVAGAEAVLVEVSERSWLHTVYDVCPDGPSRVMFVGLEGQLRELDIPTGRERALVEVPGTPPLWRLVTSHDGAFQATVAQPGLFARGRRPPPRLDIWDHARLSAG